MVEQGMGGHQVAYKVVNSPEIPKTMFSQNFPNFVSSF